MLPSGLERAIQHAAQQLAMLNILLVDLTLFGTLPRLLLQFEDYRYVN